MCDGLGGSRLLGLVSLACVVLHQMHRFVLWRSVFPLMMLIEPRHIAPGTNCTEDTTEEAGPDGVTEAAEEPTPVCDLNPITVAAYNCYEVPEAGCNGRSKVRETECCAARAPSDDLAVLVVHRCGITACIRDATTTRTSCWPAEGPGSV